MKDGNGMDYMGITEVERSRLILEVFRKQNLELYDQFHVNSTEENQDNSVFKAWPIGYKYTICQDKEWERWSTAFQLNISFIICQ